MQSSFPPSLSLPLCVCAIQDLQDMNAKRINQYKDIMLSYSEGQRKVLSVTKTCLDNISTAAEEMDPNKVTQQLKSGSHLIYLVILYICG